MTTDDNDALYQRIRAGDSTAIDEMILGNLPLAESRLRFFLKKYRRFKHLKDDLYGEAILALTKAVNSFAGMKANKPTGYLVSRINHALKNYVDSEIGAGMMTRNSVQYRRLREKPLPRKLPIDVEKPAAELWNGVNGRMERTKVELDTLGPERRVSRADARDLIQATVAETESDSDLFDQILECCETDEEKSIVKLRKDGYTDAEIGEQLGISRQTVNRRREKIEERMKKPGQ